MTSSPDESLLQRFTTEASKGHPNLRPRDASTLILLDRSGPEPKVLMGKRHEGHVFMPGRYVFPGGRIDPADRKMPVAAPLDPRAEQKLMLNIRRPSVGKARAFALTAVRETFEETGLLLGSKSQEPAAKADEAWSAFVESNIRPDLSTMHFIARAVTPPRRARRYDTRFFTADITAIAHKVDGKVGPDAELVDLVWLPLSQIKQRIELMAITELVLRDLQGLLEKGFSHDLPVPYYHVVSGRRVRDFL
ncbi:MAG: NUDIX domain-containing protein [Rhizobiales bacterium]|jgi:8-oxo-dGTP pyrophosphatase MutT (NUDIX family)|nr:NUDIX domain-containing protein [Hyphomicrobiales bacterium]